MKNATTKSGLLAAAAALHLAAAGAAAQNVVFDASDFETWTHPRGLVSVGSEGIAVRRFGKSFNAVADAGRYSASVIGDYGVLPVRAPSSQGTAHRATDQDPQTWWQPDPADPLQQWWLEVDLGRAVVARNLRVTFPDTEGARPFSFFSVYVSPGIPVFGGTAERIVYRRVGRPVNNNRSTAVDFPLQTKNIAAARAGEHFSNSSTLNFDVVRFIRFEAEGKTPEAALAEIEVEGIGFNLSRMVGTELRIEREEAHWGGRTWTSKDRDCDGCGKGAGSDELLDEDLGFRGWNIEGSDKGNWRDSGVWSVVDFGSVFRVDRMVWMPIVSGRGPFLYGYQRDKQGGWGNFEFLVSDGTPDNNADPVVEGPYAYDLLSSVENGGRYLFDFNFPPRDVRLVMWRVTRPAQFQRAVQLFVFHAEGYPARVELTSEDVHLGGALSIRRVEWDADVPPGTAIEVETETGNGFQTVERFFLKNGKEVADRNAWEAQKSRNRGPIVEEQVRDATWSTWSLPHRFSGQEFLSPTPREWLRTRVRLLSDDPEAMPALRSLTFVANPPVIRAGLTGRIHPREAALDSLQEFTYTIVPGAADGRDVGFDRVVISLPPASGDAGLVGVAVGDRPVEAAGSVGGDSLVVRLPPPVVLRDSVQVRFRTRVYQSPTVFSTSVGNSERADHVQGVVPSEFGADRVFVPGAVEGAGLVRNLVHTGVFTPNGDGANDLYELAFTLVKTGEEPRVRVYSLSGSLVAELAGHGPGAGRGRYSWDGRQAGEAVPPGIYLVDVEVDTDSRTERVQKLVHVVY